MIRVGACVCVCVRAASAWSMMQTFRCLNDVLFRICI